MQFGKLHGVLAERAYIAYVKLVPLSARQVADVQADRARKDTRIAQVTIDGISCFSSNEYRTKEHILELVEPYRYSDVGKVIWAVCYGDLTNYPSKIGAFFPDQLPMAPGNSRCVAGEKATYDSLRSLAGEGIIPGAVAAEHVHAMGLKFDAMFRLSMLGPIPPLREGGKGLVKRHPEFRRVARNGAPMASASYAFPEVRKQMVSLVREAAEKFAIDGASLGFVRGPEFMGYEQPVLDDFRKEYGEDGRKVGFDDPRMQNIRCRYLNAFVRDVRQTLDEVGKRKGRRLELSAWIWPTIPHNRNLGLDVEHWMAQGWRAERDHLRPRRAARSRVDRRGQGAPVPVHLRGAWRRRRAAQAMDAGLSCGRGRHRHLGLRLHPGLAGALVRLSEGRAPKGDRGG